jgi:outer membrane protein assembly factor BamE (lipoprotein component of BamABCDE complex)
MKYNFGKLQRLKQQAVEKAADKGSDVILKRHGITHEITRENVVKSINGMLKVMDSAMGRYYGVARYRADILKGMDKDVVTQLKSGMSKEEVLKFYWDIPEFQKIWAKLELEYPHLEKLIADVELGN